MAKTKRNATTAVTNFKAQFCQPDTGVVDAWLKKLGRDSIIVYQIDAKLRSVQTAELQKKLKAIPAQFEGFDTMITWFPKPA